MNRHNPEENLLQNGFLGTIILDYFVGAAKSGGPLFRQTVARKVSFVGHKTQLPDILRF